MTTNDPSSERRIGTLRGAGVEADGRRVGVVLTVACLVGLAAAVVILFVAAAQKNAQDNNLRQHGYVVAVKVTQCIGMLGGSGSNPVGFACRGSYSAGGHHYVENLPSDSLYQRGSLVRYVTDPADPGLLSTAHSVATERASWRAFILPTSLLAVLALLVATLALRRRRTRRRLANSAPIASAPEAAA